MYSESDVEDYDEYASAASTEELTAAELLEQQIEARDAKLSSAFLSYAWTFDDEDSFFRTSFAHLVPDKNKHSSRWNSKDSPDCFHAVSALLNAAAEGDGDARAQTEAVAATAAAAVGTTKGNGSLLPTSDTSAHATNGYVMTPADGKPSPASRFLCANFDTCILIPVDKTLNRADLRAAHADVACGTSGVEEQGLDVVPGYRHTEASGWALPLSVAPEVLAELKTRHPGWRNATAADVSLFTKPERSGAKKGGTVTAESQAPSRKRWTRDAAKLMRSRERFLTCVKEAGGWSNVVFVAVDVEAFTVAASSIPLPAEYAFVPIQPPRRSRAPPTADSAVEAASDGESASQAPGSSTASDGRPSLLRRKPLHFFCHPGHIPVEEEATILHTCLSTHLIPCRDATFLTTDYRSAVRQLDISFVRDKRIVLINKGSAESPTVMDVQAIRWLYAAALWQKHHYCDVAKLTTASADLRSHIPDAEDIRCFDVSVLEDAAAECAPYREQFQNGEAETPPPTLTRRRQVAAPRACWYHAVAEDSEVIAEEVHCAMRDARVLAQRVRDALEKWHPERLA